MASNFADGPGSPSSDDADAMWMNEVMRGWGTTKIFVHLSPGNESGTQSLLVLLICVETAKCRHTVTLDVNGNRPYIEWIKSPPREQGIRRLLTATHRSSIKQTPSGTDVVREKTQQTSKEGIAHCGFYSQHRGTSVAFILSSLHTSRSPITQVCRTALYASPRLAFPFSDTIATVLNNRRHLKSTPVLGGDSSYAHKLDSGISRQRQEKKTISCCSFHGPSPILAQDQKECRVDKKVAQKRRNGALSFAHRCCHLMTNQQKTCHLMKSPKKKKCKYADPRLTPQIENALCWPPMIKGC
ncbi:hypothetical protein ACRALDRAFT_212434 [Sodiomyces alcalophilus JCM 7366]|uniref:uncharacterized protein n=1 Tax=Sodiomyces alcalophilus JCM 7366 TaxID=591952 RepID=UPI0039B51E3B